ncbi:MAG: TVP38/TMEM64 family protein [Planctomycetaceae bacterium]|nr:TVP38/TMEM64 family protein [Planctomycetaceae bacterium]
MPKQIAVADAGSGLGKKFALLAIVVGIVFAAYVQFGDTLTLANLAQQESQLRAFQAEYPVLVYGLAFLVYVTVTGLSLPGATALTLLYGWYFGLLRGVVVVSFASTTGATLAFLLSRFLFRDAIQRRFGDRLENFNRALEREGPFFLFTLRLIPAVPFFVINAVMGLTPIRARTFWWVSQLGMLAGTAVYTYAGSSVPSLQTLAEQRINAIFTPTQVTQIVIALTLLGVFPLAVRWVMNLVARGDQSNPANDIEQANAA